MFVFFSSLCFFTNFVFCVLCLRFRSTLYSYTLKSQTQTTLFVFWGQHRNTKFVFVFVFVFANWGHCKRAVSMIRRTNGFWRFLAIGIVDQSVEKWFFLWQERMKMQVNVRSCDTKNDLFHNPNIRSSDHRDCPKTKNSIHEEFFVLKCHTLP